MCDASDYAVGDVLGQRVDKKLNVIQYASKTCWGYTTRRKPARRGRVNPISSSSVSEVDEDRR